MGERPKLDELKLRKLQLIFAKFDDQNAGRLSKVLSEHRKLYISRWRDAVALPFQAKQARSVYILNFGFRNADPLSNALQALACDPAHRTQDQPAGGRGESHEDCQSWLPPQSDATWCNTRRGTAWQSIMYHSIDEESILPILPKLWYVQRFAAIDNQV